MGESPGLRVSGVFWTDQGVGSEGSAGAQRSPGLREWASCVASEEAAQAAKHPEVLPGGTGSVRFGVEGRQVDRLKAEGVLRVFMG